jgi:hypothetical protein
LNAN